MNVESKLERSNTPYSYTERKKSSCALMTLQRLLRASSRRHHHLLPMSYYSPLFLIFDDGAADFVHLSLAILHIHFFLSTLDRRDLVNSTPKRIVLN